MSLPVDGCITVCTEYCPLRTLTQASVSRLITGVSLHRHDWLSQSPGPLPFLEVGLMSPGVKPQASDDLVGLSSGVSPSPELSFLHKFPGGGWSGPPWITKTLLSLRKSQGFRGYFPSTGPKASRILNYPTVYMWCISYTCIFSTWKCSKTFVKWTSEWQQAGVRKEEWKLRTLGSNLLPHSYTLSIRT